MDGFTRRKEQSKEDIRKAAWALFSQFGVEKVSIADISRKAGVSHATIYNNFGSKEALIREFVTTMVDQLMTRVQDVLAPDIPFDEKIAAFIQFIFQMLADQKPPMANRTVFMSSIDLQQDPEINKIRVSSQEKMTDLLLGLAQEGKAQGQIDSSLSEESLRVYFQAFMNIFVNPQLQHSFHNDPKIVQDLGALMLNGLCGPRNE